MRCAKLKRLKKVKMYNMYISQDAGFYCQPSVLNANYKCTQTRINSLLTCTLKIM